MSSVNTRPFLIRSYAFLPNVIVFLDCNSPFAGSIVVWGLVVSILNTKWVWALPNVNMPSRGELGKDSMSAADRLILNAYGGLIFYGLYIKRFARIVFYLLFV